MIKYKAKCNCYIARDGISVQISKGTIWAYLGCVKDSVTLYRNDVSIDIPKGRINNLFRELKEQNNG